LIILGFNTNDLASDIVTADDSKIFGRAEDEMDRGTITDQFIIN